MPTQTHSGRRSVAPSPTTRSPPEQSAQATLRTTPLGRKVRRGRLSGREASSSYEHVLIASHDLGGEEEAPPRKKRALSDAARPTGWPKSARDAPSDAPPNYSSHYRTSSRVNAPTRSRHSRPGPATDSQLHSPVVSSSPRQHQSEKNPMLARFIGKADEDDPIVECDDEEIELKCPFPPALPYTWPVVIPEDAPGVDQENYIEEMCEQLLPMLEYVEYYMKETEFVGMSSQRDVERARTYLNWEQEKLSNAVRNFAQASENGADFIDWFTVEAERVYERLLKDRDSYSSDDEERAAHEPQEGDTREAEKDIDEGARADNESESSLSSGGCSLGKRRRGESEPVIIREVYRLKQAELREQLSCLDGMEHDGGFGGD